MTPSSRYLNAPPVFGSDNVRDFAPSELHQSADISVVLSSMDCLVGAPEWVAAIQAHEQSKIYVTTCLGYAQAWLAAGRAPNELPPPPGDINSAYRLWFELQPPTPAVQQLLAVVMAAREPLSSAHLDTLDLLAVRDSLPGWGLLFEDREHLLQTLHLSVREFSTDAGRSGVHVADVARGHVVLARSCLQIMQQRSSGPTHAYALRHGHVHMTEVLSSMATDPEHDRQSMAVVHDWFQVFLKPRRSTDSAVCDEVDADCDGTTQSDELEPEAADLSYADSPIAAANPTNSKVLLNEQRDDVLQTPMNPTSQLDEPQSKTVEETCQQVTSDGFFQSYRHSSWKARAFTTTWLERQAKQGRSKLLVPELLSLEAQLRKHFDGDQADGVQHWLGGLLQLVTHLRWGIGTFWAPHYETNPDTAKGMFGANIPVISPLHESDASAILGAHRLCLPARVDISPTIHQLIGHSDAVSSASFSPDGTKVVSGSGDQTVRIWDAVTGECEQTLEGHSDYVLSASFSPDGTKVVSCSGDDFAILLGTESDKTVRIWDAVTGECEQTLEGHSRGVTSASFSPDGTKVVSGSNDETVRLWDAVTGECEQTLEGHSAGVMSASFSPDGTKVVSGSNDETVRIWDAVTGECEQTLEGHSSDVSSAS
eukprot:COSAG05_NODE_2972_length_2450_cov_68.754573_1_plen_651_part_10